MAKAPTSKAEGLRPIIIRREEVVGGGHHGGAWKVAYADFVTAMMAFFLLMWLLNATTEAQRKGLADFFTPSNALSHGSSGSGQPFGGNTPFADGHAISDRGAEAVQPGTMPLLPDPEADSDQTPTPRLDAGGGADPAAKQAGGGGQASAASTVAVKADMPAQAGSGLNKDPTKLADAALRAELDRRERIAFADAAQQIRAAVAADPQLADLAKQLVIDVTPEGLRIQLLDADKEPMFATGSAAILERAQALLRKVAVVLTPLSEKVSIAGHTDAAPYAGALHSNWELSAARADATRRLLTEAGLSESRIRAVTGNADRDPLLPADPMAAANRRIAIVVLRSAGVR